MVRAGTKTSTTFLVEHYRPGFSADGPFERITTVIPVDERSGRPTSKGRST